MEERRALRVIVGSGVAGLFAALHLAPHGPVCLLTRKRLGDGNSGYAQGGIAAVWDDEDTFGGHVADTLAAGVGLCDPVAVDLLVREGPERIRDLIRRGALFDHDEAGRILLTREGGHHHRRILHANGDATGREMVRALVEAVRADARIEVIEGFRVADLLLQDGLVTGLWGWQADRPVRIRTSQVLLAGGGLAGLYLETTNPPETAGDGVVMAWAAGARLADLEFIQFHPTALAVPGLARDLLTEALRGEGAWLTDDQGERFMQGVHPLAELAPRDIVTRAAIRRMRETGTPNVWLDARHLPVALLTRRFPTVEATVNRAGLSLARDRIPVAPAAHYTMGGVWTDAEGRTTVPGLFAAGEVACTGVHGANRLASNSLLECLVFGYRAATAMSCEAARPDRDGRQVRAEGAWGFPRPLALDECRRRLGQDLGPVRTGDGLAAVLAECAVRLDERHPADPGALDPEGLAARNATALVGLLARFADRRRESRGSHFRLDCPDADPQWAFRQCLTGDQWSSLSPALPGGK